MADDPTQLVRPNPARPVEFPNLASFSFGWGIFATGSAEGDERSRQIVNGKPYGHRPYELCKLDDPDDALRGGKPKHNFGSDLQVWRYIVGQIQKKEGKDLESDIALTAMTFLAEHSPVEYKDILDTCCEPS
jgi:hypothetical protein